MRPWPVLKTFKVAALREKRKKGGREMLLQSSIRLEYHWTLCHALSFFSSIAAYGVTPLKSVFTGTGQERARPRFPARVVPGPPR